MLIGGSTNPLSIHFHEPLDYFLFPETIQILNDEGTIMETDLHVTVGEKTIEIVPKKMESRRYRLRIASHLEDLVGYNLNRLFDRDVNALKKKSRVSVKDLLRYDEIIFNFYKAIIY